MNSARPRLFNSSLFTVTTKNLLVGEISDLGNSAVPSEFRVKSDRTGKVASFGQMGVEKDAEGGVICWHYRCTSPGLDHVRAVFFND